MPRRKDEGEGSVAVAEPEMAEAAEVVWAAPPPRDYELWEVSPLDAATARQLRLMLAIDEDWPLPGSVLKVLSDFAAEASGDSLRSPTISTEMLKWAIQIADLKYPVRVEIPFTSGETVRSKTFSRLVRYCRPAALGRVVIEFSGQLHVVIASDLEPAE